ncbi:hypothetical protein NUSPORA_01774 [Nucleospora cyclopteri]
MIFLIKKIAVIEAPMAYSIANARFIQRPVLLEGFIVNLVSLAYILISINE